MPKPASPTPKRGGPTSPKVSTATKRHSPIEQARREKEESRRREEEERAARQAEEEERRREEERERERALAEVEAARPPSRPSSPEPQPLQLPVATFIWLRDRASAAGRDVQPSVDRNIVILPAATVTKLFEGNLVQGVVDGYLPRTDDQRSKRGAASLAVTDSPQAQGLEPPAQPRRTFGIKAHSALAGIASPDRSAAARSNPASSPSLRHSVSVIQPGDEVTSPWPEGDFPVMEARLAVWNRIRRHCRRLGLEMSPELVCEIADECDADSLRSFIEGLHQCVRKADALRKEYSKSLIVEAAAPTPTHAKEVHKAPPPSHVELVEKRVMKSMSLPPLRGLRAERDQLRMRSRSPTLAPAPTAHPHPKQSDEDRDDESGTPVDSAGQGAPRSSKSVSLPPESDAAADAPPIAPEPDVASSPPASTVKQTTTTGTQTVGRCVIIFDDTAEDPTGEVGLVSMEVAALVTAKARGGSDTPAAPPPPDERASEQPAAAPPASAPAAVGPSDGSPKNSESKAEQPAAGTPTNGAPAPPPSVPAEEAEAANDANVPPDSKPPGDAAPLLPVSSAPKESDEAKDDEHRDSPRNDDHSSS